MQLQPKQLKAFLAVIEAGGMSAAAKTMGITQPAVSRLIFDLEETLGFRLFERLNNRIIPTAEARLFLEHVEHWHIGLENIGDAALGIRNSGIGRISLAAMSGLSFGLLNNIVGDFLRDRPNVSFALEVGNSSTTLRLISTFKVDVGLVQWRAESQSVNLIRLPPFAAVCVMRADHPLASRDHISVEDLQGEELISLHSENPLRIRTDAALLTAGVSVIRRIEASTAASICELVAQGFGVGIINPFLSNVGGSTLVHKSFTPILPYEIAVALPKHRTRPKLVDEFVKHLISELKNHASVPPAPSAIGEAIQSKSL